MKKKKPSGGRKRMWRKKRKFESGSFPTETTLGELKKKINRGRGGNIKFRLLSTRYVNVSNPSTGKTERGKILRVSGNQANVDYDRRGVLTKGAIIETTLGTARLTSRPGQSGLVNAVLFVKED